MSMINLYISYKDIYAQGSRSILGRKLKVRILKRFAQILHRVWRFNQGFLDAINTNITLPKIVRIFQQQRIIYHPHDLVTILIFIKHPLLNSLFPMGSRTCLPFVELKIYIPLICCLTKATHCPFVL